MKNLFHKIIIVPVNNGYKTFYNSDLIGEWRNPKIEASKWLINNDIATPQDILTMYYDNDIIIHERISRLLKLGEPIKQPEIIYKNVEVIVEKIVEKIVYQKEIINVYKTEEYNFLLKKYEAETFKLKQQNINLVQEIIRLRQQQEEENMPQRPKNSQHQNDIEHAQKRIIELEQELEQVKQYAYHMKQEKEALETKVFDLNVEITKLRAGTTIKGKDFFS